MGMSCEKGFDGTFRQSGESIIGGSEDGEGTLALQGFDQASSLDSGDEGIKVASSNGGFNDIFGHWRIHGGVM